MVLLCAVAFFFFAGPPRSSPKILGDEKKRKLYNQYGKKGLEAGGNPGGGSQEDLMRSDNVLSMFVCQCSVNVCMI